MRPEAALGDDGAIVVIDQDDRAGARAVGFASDESTGEEPLALDTDTRVREHVVGPFALVTEQGEQRVHVGGGVRGDPVREVFDQCLGLGPGRVEVGIAQAVDTRLDQLGTRARMIAE